MSDKPSLSRRSFLKRTAGLTVASAVGISSPPIIRARAETQLVWCGWGGQYQQDQANAFAAPFTKETGIKVTQVASPGSMVPAIKAQVDNNNPEWDIVELTLPEVFTMVDGGYLSPLSYDKAAAGEYPPGVLGDYSAPFIYAAYVLAWNTTSFPASHAPKDWADFWNAKDFPGRRTSCSWFPQSNVEIALMADGVPPNQVYPLDADKVERAFRKLKELKPNIAVWWNAGGQSVQLFADAEVVMGMVYLNRILEVKKAGKPVTWTVNQAFIEPAAYVIPKGSKNKEAAMKFINIALQKQNQAVFVRSNEGYGAANPATYSLLDDSQKQNSIGLPANLSHEIIEDGKFWAANGPKYSDRWEALKAG